MWVPVLAGVITVIVTIFAWQFEKSRNEVFESVKSEATRVAKQKIDDIVAPDEIYQAVFDTREQIIGNLQDLKTALVKNAEEEINIIRDDFVAQKSDMIREALDEPLRNAFKNELNILERIEDMEKTLNNLKKSEQEKSDIELEKISSKPFDELRYKRRLKILSQAEIENIHNEMMVNKKIMEAEQKRMELQQRKYERQKREMERLRRNVKSEDA